MKSDPAARSLLSALHWNHRIEAALELVERKLKRRPERWLWHAYRAELLRALGRIPSADEVWRRARRLNPRTTEPPRLDGLVDLAREAPPPADLEAHSLALYLSQFDADADVAMLRRRHRAWGRRVSSRNRDRSRSPGWPGMERGGDRRIKLGYASGDFGRHPVGFFLSGVLGRHDRERFEIHAFSDRLGDDPVTEAIRRHCDRWHSTANLDDAAVTERVRAQGIDALVDLAGHAEGNRLPVFARRAAPLQLSWIGYGDTTGLAAMDFLISDGWEVPDGTEAGLTEAVVRLPGGRLCYAPPTDAPAVGGGGTRPLTLGCFGKPAKLAPAVIETWAEILRGLPDARVLLKWRGLGNGEPQRRWREAFASLGVAGDRLLFQDWSDHAELLSTYAEIDIALDPFPFAGGLTSCEALWMGVPVVGTIGDRPLGRQSASILHRAGLGDLVAADRAHYAAIVRSLALDERRRRELRHGLRERLRRSAVCDGAAAAHALESVVDAGLSLLSASPPPQFRPN
jgi:predicted O-linked N-acetylglucosamine transferase (SPINDLY family)